MKLSSEPLTRVGLSVFLVGGFAICAAAQYLPAPTRVWSVGPLTKAEQVMGFAVGPGGTTLTGPHIDSQTGSTYAATRSAVFVGDRLILASKTGMRQVPHAKIPVQVYQLLSLDTQTGQVKEKREITAFGSLPVFATNDAHVIVAGHNVLRLAPDLKDAGVLDYHGSAENMSPDGSTLGNATSPGYELIDARSLKRHQTDRWLRLRYIGKQQGFRYGQRSLDGKIS